MRGILTHSNPYDDTYSMNGHNYQAIINFLHHTKFGNPSLADRFIGLAVIDGNCVDSDYYRI